MDAVRALQRLRPARLTTEGGGELEPDAIEQDIQEKRNADKGNWLDLFRGTNLRRTTVRGFTDAHGRSTRTEHLFSDMHCALHFSAMDRYANRERRLTANTDIFSS